MLQETEHIIEYILLTYITIQVIYLLLFSLAGKLFPKKAFPSATKFRSVRILIPGYKEDAVIIATAKNAIQQDYPKDKYEVVIIADSFSQSTLQSLASLPIKVVEVSFVSN